MRNLMRVMLAATAFAAGPAAAAAAANDAAVRFGTRDVLGVSISPDGASLAILRPNGPRGTVLQIAPVDGSTPPKAILASDGAPKRLSQCRWSTASRLVCSVFIIDDVYGQKRGGTRLIAINADGSLMREMSARGNDRSLGVALGGGDVIDWLGENNDGSVLMARWFIPEQTTGTFTSSRRQGLGVERVNLLSMGRKLVETPNPAATGYITDGHGTVRIMAIGRRNTLGQSTNQYEYRYRKKGSRDWLPLATTTISNYHVTGFQALAVDPDLDVVYGLENLAGRTGLYKIALDGTMKKELVFGSPATSYGIDEVVQIGRQSRVVGASWITEKRQVAMFDPELTRFTASLSKALPNTPIISIVDASADEKQLVIFAGSDDDAGRFYLYDKTTRHLGVIRPVRPLLAATKLAEQKPISYPAADGKMIPAYLTLPPGSSGKNLPAIVLPHGGPTYRDEWNFDWLPQYFANRGFAVIQPQYRGSSGFGTEFFNQNAIRSWRTAIGDVNDAGRWMVKQGIADPGKLAIVGWSYGGYAALQSQVVAPELFKAVVAIAPVTDFGEIHRAATLQGNSTPEALDAVFGDARTAEEGSPARHADRFAAPVLMFMGDVDQNVPIAQARLMEDRLKGAGKKVRYVEYKGLDHQLEDSAVRAEMLDSADAFLRTSMGM